MALPLTVDTGITETPSPAVPKLSVIEGGVLSTECIHLIQRAQDRLNGVFGIECLLGPRGAIVGMQPGARSKIEALM